MKQNRIFLIIALVLTICFFSGFLHYYHHGLCHGGFQPVAAAEPHAAGGVDVDRDRYERCAGG